ncbi:MAG: hypothetical protein R3F17_05525 [Planctomycetota bacterium]
MWSRSLPITALVAVALACLFGCKPDEGSRRPHKAFHDGGDPPMVRYEGEEVFWQGEWLADGPVTYFDRTGRVTGKGQFKLGKEEGPWSLLEEGGYLAEGEFKEGKREGQWMYRYSSGKIQEEGSYTAGKRVGEWRTYYSNGNLRSVTQYVDGEAQPGAETYDADGVKHTR